MIIAALLDIQGRCERFIVE